MRAHAPARGPVLASSSECPRPWGAEPAACAAEASRSLAATAWSGNQAVGVRFAQCLARARRARRLKGAQATAHAARKPTQGGQDLDRARETLERRTFTPSPRLSFALRHRPTAELRADFHVTSEHPARRARA